MHARPTKRLSRSCSSVDAIGLLTNGLLANGLLANGLLANGLLAVAVVVAIGTAAAAQLPSAASNPRLSLHVPVPPPVVLTDGVYRSLYELHIENRSDTIVTLSYLGIRTGADANTNPNTAKHALTLDGDRLIRALDTPAAPADRPAPLAIAVGQRRVLYLDVDLGRGGTTPPRVLHHRLRFRSTAASPAATGEAETLTLAVNVDPTPPVILGPPLAGGPWAAVYHSDWERGHRRVFYTVDGVTRLPGRHTIDFVKLDDAGRKTRGGGGDGGDGDVVADSLGYGADVLAVSDATVAAIRDDMPEAARVSARVKNTQEDAAGNYVSLDLGNGRFAVYEHLKPRSIRVRAGQHVRRGDIIAQLGFTGDSTGPHLHMHIGDAVSPLGAEGRPFVFDRFELIGRYADIAAMGKARWQTGATGPRQHERPGPNTVINFGNVGPPR